MIYCKGSTQIRLVGSQIVVTELAILIKISSIFLMMCPSLTYWIPNARDRHSTLWHSSNYHYNFTILSSFHSLDSLLNRDSTISCGRPVTDLQADPRLHFTFPIQVITQTSLSLSWCWISTPILFFSGTWSISHNWLDLFCLSWADFLIKFMRD